MFLNFVTKIPPVFLGADVQDIVDPITTPTTTTSGGSISGVFDSGLQLTDFAFKLFDLAIAHPLLSLFIAAAIVSLGAGLVGRFAGISKSFA